MNEAHYESAHEQSIHRLIGRFGETNKPAIERMYQEERAISERDATVRIHIPTLLEGKVRRRFTESQTSII